MKFKSSKKFISLFLAVLMIVSSVPAFAISASASTNTDDVSALTQAIQNYETKMNGTIYTNMLSAYNYYVAAQKALDVSVYGYNNNFVASAAQNLTDATNAMQPWTAYTASKYGTFPGEGGDGFDTEANYLSFWKNVLWSTTAASVGSNTVQIFAQSWKDWSASCYDVSTFYYPETVMMYDGTTNPQMGIVYSSKENGGYSVIQTHSASLKSNYGGLKFARDRWKGTDSKTNCVWMNIVAGDDIYSTTGHDSHNSATHGKSEVFWANVLTYDGSTDVFGSGEYLKTYKPTFNARMWDKDKSAGDKDNDVTSNTPIYVFNYKAIKDKLKSISLPDVKNYKYDGGLKDVLSTIDKLTVDPNSFFTSSNNINACVSHYSDAMSAIDSQISSAAADNNVASYQALRNAIANAETVTGKTADSAVAYGHALKNAIDLFGAPISSYTDGDTAQSLATAIETAKNALVNVDSDSAYDNFDAAVAVVSAMDKDAFKDANEVQTKIDEAKAQVYTTLSGDDATYYQLATGQAPTAPLKNSAAVDTVTKGLLEFASNPGDENIKSFSVKLGATVFNKGSETNLDEKDLGTKKYGDIIEVNVNDEFAEVNSIADKSISWSVQYKDYSGNTISTQKVYNDEPTIKVKATANIVITAFVTNDTKTEESAGYTVKFLDIYGKLSDVTYTSEKPVSGVIEGETYTVGSKTYSPVIPFYTIAGFNVSAPDANNVVTVRPTYTTEIRLGITVINGSASSSSLKGDGSVQKTKTVTVSTDVPHIGWAVKNGDKYQIVAYTKGDYDFVALGDNSVIYTPIISMDDGYAVYADDASTIKLTASNVDGFANNSMVSTDKVSDDVYLNAKIANKAPFTYVEDYTTVQVDGTTMYRYYVRVTAGSDSSINSFGVEASGKKYAIVSKNDTTGQYSATFRSPKSNFSAYVSYNFSYNYGGENYNISTTDSVQYNA